MRATEGTCIYLYAPEHISVLRANNSSRALLASHVVCAAGTVLPVTKASSVPPYSCRFTADQQTTQASATKYTQHRCIFPPTF